MKKLIVVSFLCIQFTVSFAQSVYITRTGKISFFSKTSMADIEAVNKEVTSIFNLETLEIGFSVPIKSFRFQWALMEEHFNENYLESNKFPKATFQGKVTNLSADDLKKEGSYAVVVRGDLTMHGVTQNITAKGEVVIEKAGISATSAFIVKLADFKIEVPSLVANKISESLEIKVNCQYKPKN